MIREISLSDLKELEGHQNDFAMPDVLNPRYFYQIALEDESGELIGAAFVKLTTETSLIFKHGVGKLKKAKAYLEMFQAVEDAHERAGLEDTHIFVLGPEEEVEHYQQVLRKIGFLDARGKPMYYRLGDRKWLKEQRKIQRKRQKMSETLLQLS